MNRHAEVFQHDGFGLFFGKKPHVVGQLERLRHLVCGIVVAGYQIDGDTRLAEPLHLGDEEQPGVEILPIAVVQVARDQHEGDLFVHGQPHEILQRSPRRMTNLFGRRGFVAIDSSPRAVEMNIRGMNELQHH